MKIDTALLTDEEKKRIALMGDGFVEQYVDYASRITDAPWEYHLGVGLSLLSAVVGPSAIDPLYRTKPNLWILLLGPSSSFRKTTSLNIGTSLLRRLDPTIFVATDFSPQALISDIAGRNNQTAMFVRDEVSGLFRTMKGASFMAGIKEVLIKLFDGDSFTRKLRSEEIVVENPYFVWLGGGVEEKLIESVEEDDIFSGFLIRFCLLRPTERGPFRPLTYEPVILDDVRDDLIVQLRSIRNRLTARSSFFIGPRVLDLAPPTWFVLSGDSLERFNHYIEDLERFHSPTPLHEKLNSRVGPMAMKLAILIHCSHQMWDNHWLNTAIIAEDAMLKAILFAELFRTHTSRVLGGVGMAHGERQLDHVLALINRRPGVTRSAIMRRFKLRAPQMDEIKRTLIERSLAVCVMKKTKTKSSELFYPPSSNGRKKTDKITI